MADRVYRLRLSTPPPSVNAMWRAVVRGKNAVNILSKDGRAWKEMAELELMSQQGLGSDPQYWRADILIPGKGARVDLDNNLKGILDALGAAGKSPDDRYLVDLRIRFHSGDHVAIALKQEDLSTWAKIRNASKSLIQKLAKFSS